MAVSQKMDRIDLRIDVADKETLEMAARMNHLSLSSYILSISLKQAEYDLKQNEQLFLGEEGKKLIMQMLEDTPEPTEKLKGLFK